MKPFAETCEILRKGRFDAICVFWGFQGFASLPRFTGQLPHLHFVCSCSYFADLRFALQRRLGDGTLLAYFKSVSWSGLVASCFRRACMESESVCGSSLEQALFFDFGALFVEAGERLVRKQSYKSGRQVLDCVSLVIFGKTSVRLSLSLYV